MLHYLGVLMQWFNGTAATVSPPVTAYARVGPTYTANASTGATYNAAPQIAATLRPSVIILPL